MEENAFPDMAKADLSTSESCLQRASTMDTAIPPVSANKQNSNGTSHGEVDNKSGQAD